jgi:hypothetical protein
LMFGVGVVIVRVALDAGQVFGAGACSYSRVSADCRQALKCNFIWDLILGVFPLDARHLGRGPSRPLEEQGLGRDPFPLATRGLGLQSSQFREPVALKRARITAPLCCLPVDWCSSMSDSDEPSLSSDSESSGFSTCSRLDSGSLGFLTAIPC